MSLSPSTQMRITVAVCVLITITSLSLAAQSTRHLVRDQAGAVACIVRVPDGRSATPDADLVVVDIRVPARPTDALLARLPASRRDYSTRPIRVFLVPAPGKGDRVSARLPQVTPLAADLAPRPWDETTPDLFVRVEYARAHLRAGLDLVAERTAVTDSGEQITTQTRCRIGTADASAWR